MERIWIVSDTHFGHGNIIKYCSRPYENVAEMDADIIKRWNSVVHGGDIVYHLGDFAMGNQQTVSEYRSKLNGRIKLIKGNHDDHSNRWYRDCGFEEVYDRPIVVQGFYILSHAPLEFMTEQIPFANIFGHVHNDDRFKHFGPNFYNACLELNSYFPTLFVSIQEFMKSAATDGAYS